MNGNTGSNVYVSSNGQPIPDNFIFQTVDPSQDDESDSDSGAPYHATQGHGFQQNISTTGLKPGKKTKGRVKIKMEFIENKLRRYTTFSKRKTGIMKKAYELSTLTGTQVMLLVASETGHVYTFATRKLQPMITSESGKALIQTCLNSPDPPPGASSGNSLEQRMNPSGFEETELSCVVGEEEQKVFETSSKPVFPVVTVQQPQPQQQQPQQQQPQPQNEQQSNLEQVVKAQREVATVPVSVKTLPSVSNTTTSQNNKELTSSNGNNTTTSISAMQIPLILSQGSVPQTISIPQITTTSSSHNVLKPSALSHVVTALNNQAASHSQTNSSGELNTPLPVSTPSINIMQNMTPGIVMYHTPQGVVYATPTQNLHDRTIFNFSQPPSAISMTQADQISGQQFITIPVPMGGTPLMQLANPPTSNNNTAVDTGQGKQPPTKKLKK